MCAWLETSEFLINSYFPTKNSGNSDPSLFSSTNNLSHRHKAERGPSNMGNYSNNPYHRHNSTSASATRGNSGIGESATVLPIPAVHNILLKLAQYILKLVFMYIPAARVRVLDAILGQ